MRVIFLDIDGVLINRESLPSMRAHPDCIRALNAITDNTGAQIVLSSTWRFMRGIRDILRDWGAHATVISSTPSLETRGQEIAQWLSERPQAESFIIIDDETFDLGDLVSRTVVTGFSLGLTDEHVAMAISMLNDTPQR